MNNVVLIFLLGRCKVSLLLIFLTAIQSLAAASQPQPNRWLQEWTLKTDDTTLTLGVGSDQQLYIEQLAGPKGWNWTTQPFRFAFVDLIKIEDKEQSLNWGFAGGSKSTNDGTEVTISFTNSTPDLELTSIWQARPGPGPVRHTMFIRNRSAETVTIFEQESISLRSSEPSGHTSCWFVNDDASLPDKIGVYHEPLTAGYKKELHFSEDPDFIPFIAIDANGQQGVYIGWEWTIGRMVISSEGAPVSTTVKVGNGDNFQTDLSPNETFAVPPAFLGAYQGDIDDGGNSLRRYLFNYSIPQVLRDDPGYPKVEWNAFAATGKSQGGWDSVESKYYPLIDEIAPLGFEEIVLDVGWWEGDTTHKPHPPVGDSVDWRSGIPAARKYAHDRGMRFGLYWNCNPSMTTPTGIQHRLSDTRYMYDRFRIDFFRSDSTDGNVLQTGSFGPETRAHSTNDVGYWQTKGYYEVLDSLYQTIPNYSYECCSGGGRLKDYGTLKRAIKIQNQDRYYPLDARQSFYDASFVLHPMQLAALAGSWAEWQAAGSVFEFRSSSMGAAYWHPDAPGGRNGGPVWPESQRQAIKNAVETYKTMLRPLIRTANLYHIFPRPTGKIWDGIEYFDPKSQRGVVYAFRPECPDSAMTIRLKGLDSQANYWLWCADGSFNATQKTGTSLMREGFFLSLNQTNRSELVFFQDVRLGEPKKLNLPEKSE